MAFGGLSCPDCGLRFNWLQRAVGEYKRHRRKCADLHGAGTHIPYSTGCRGCPAGCYDRSKDLINDNSESGGRDDKPEKLMTNRK